MSLLTILVGLGLLVLAYVFIAFPQARALLHGFINIFIEDRATTPEGARAIYQEKIDEQQEIYNYADDSLKKAAGRYKQTAVELENLQNRLERVERECENLAKSGADEELLLAKAQERGSIAQNIVHTQDMLEKYKEATVQAKQIHEQSELELRRLKQEQKDVVQRMRDNKNLKELYDQMDDLKATSGTDKLLEAVKEKDKELSEIAAGAQVVHQNKLSTKLQIAEKKSYEQETFDYVKQLQAKYNKNPQTRQIKG